MVSSTVSYPWHWPNDVNQPGQVQHSYPVPPLPRLIAIGAGSHPAQQGERAYDRMSFTFTTAFPGYQFTFTKALVADPSGKPVKLAGNGVLKVTFRLAQAHTASGRSSIAVQPPAQLGLSRMASWAQAGDFEGVVTFGIGVTWPSSAVEPADSGARDGGRESHRPGPASLRRRDRHRRNGLIAALEQARRSPAGPARDHDGGVTAASGRRLCSTSWPCPGRRW